MLGFFSFAGTFYYLPIWRRNLWWLWRRDAEKIPAQTHHIRMPKQDRAMWILWKGVRLPLRKGEITFINLLANLTPRSVAFRPRHACITESSDLLPKIIQEVYSDWPVRKKRRWKHLSILGDAFPRLGTAFGSHDCENKQKTDRSLCSRPSWSKSYSKPVLLSFWASNSPFCRSSAQKFRHIHVGWRRNANEKS